MMARRRLALCLALLALPGAAAAGDPWSRADLAWQGLFVATAAVDWGQTLDLIERPGYWERNPILGEHPSRGEVNAYFVLGLTAHTVIADRLSGPHRRWWQAGWVLVELVVIAGNQGRGIEVRF